MSTQNVVRFEILGQIIAITLPPGATARHLVSTGTQTGGMGTQSNDLAIHNVPPVRPPDVPPVYLPTQMDHVLHLPTLPPDGVKDETRNYLQIHRGMQPLTVALPDAPRPVLLPTQSLLLATTQNTASTNAPGKRKRHFGFASACDSSTPPASSTPRAEKRLRLGDPGLGQALPSNEILQPRPFPMDIALERKIIEENRNLPPVPDIYIPKYREPEPSTAVGDFLFISNTTLGKYFPYEVIRRDQSTMSFDLRPYGEVVLEPGQSLSPITAPFKDVLKAESLRLDVSQVARIRWPAAYIPSTIPEEDFPATPNWFATYSNFIIQQIVRVPPTSPFKAMLDDWKVLLGKGTPTANTGFTFFSHAMKSVTGHHVDELLSPEDHIELSVTGEELNKQLLTRYAHEAIPATVSGPGHIILAFVLLSMKVKRSIPDTVKLFLNGDIRPNDKLHSVWNCYDRHVKYPRMSPDQIKVRIFEADENLDMLYVAP